MPLEMATQEYDMVFVGGGLAALLLLQELRTALPDRVAVVDPSPLIGRTPVHWSYWIHEQTPYDRFAVGVWRKARIADMPPEPIARFALRLVRSTDVFSHVAESLSSTAIEWLQTTARSIRAGRMVSTRSPPTPAPCAPAGCSTAPSTPSSLRRMNRGR